MLDNIICITNRKLCSKNTESSQSSPGENLLAQEALPAQKALLAQLSRVAAAGPRAVILREKDLPLEDYTKLLLECQKLCNRYHILLIAHSFIPSARQLGIKAIHLPLPQLLAGGQRPEGFRLVGTSIHSVDDAKKALALGADYLIAGHIFETGCKAGLPGRGLKFLEKICRLSSVPVYGIGGITPENLPKVIATGAAGGCMMSSLMQPDVSLPDLTGPYRTLPGLTGPYRH